MEYIYVHGGACGVMDIIVGNGYGDTNLKTWMKLFVFHKHYCLKNRGKRDQE